MVQTRPWLKLRETSPPYGSAPSTAARPEATRIEVANRLLEGWDALVRAENSCALVEGDTLRVVVDSRAYRRLGYQSFHDFSVEAVELSFSTAKRRVALSRTATVFPQVRAALLEGRLSPC